MTHSKAQQLYRLILEYVCFAKMLEFHIKIEYLLTVDSMLEAFTKKEMPQRGSLVYRGQTYDWRLHGLGVTFEWQRFRFHYNIAPTYGIGVSFHAVSLLDFIKHSNIDWETSTEELDGLLEHLAERRLVRRLWEGYGVYGLT